jgi:hypothetical protein
VEKLLQLMRGPFDAGKESRLAEPFGFECVTCGTYHVGMPSFGWDYPVQYLLIPEPERERRIDLSSDTCVIDDKWFFVRGCLEIPVHEQDEPLSWGVWCSLSKETFLRYGEIFDKVEREAGESFFGWLCSAVPGHPDTQQLKTMVHVRPWPTRPFVELESTDHPLAIEQRQGITVARAREIAERFMHGTER